MSEEPLEVNIYVSGSKDVTLIRGDARIVFAKSDNDPPPQIVLPKPGKPGSGGVVVALVHFVDNADAVGFKPTEDPTRVNTNLPTVNLDDLDDVLSLAVQRGESVEIHVTR